MLVPLVRLPRWFENLESRHGPAMLVAASGLLRATAEDGTVVEASLPLGRAYDGPPDVAALADAAATPLAWGILLVRKGGFAVAAVEGEAIVASKVGQRHVQGRTKAGGQSQQRFARRRDNQARQAYEAAAGHAHRILVLGSAAPAALVCGGDRSAVDAVLADARLSQLSVVRTDPWLAVPDPRRSVLEQAVSDALSVSMTIVEPE